MTMPCGVNKMQVEKLFYSRSLTMVFTKDLDTSFKGQTTKGANEGFLPQEVEYLLVASTCARCLKIQNASTKGNSKWEIRSTSPSLCAFYPSPMSSTYPKTPSAIRSSMLTS